MWLKYGMKIDNFWNLQQQRVQLSPTPLFIIMTTALFQFQLPIVFELYNTAQHRTINNFGAECIAKGILITSTLHIPTNTIPSLHFGSALNAR
jgi:hypothetical protein